MLLAESKAVRSWRQSSQVQKERGTTQNQSVEALDTDVGYSKLTVFFFARSPEAPRTTMMVFSFNSTLPALASTSGLMTVSAMAMRFVVAREIIEGKVGVREVAAVLLCAIGYLPNGSALVVVVIFCWEFGARV